MIMLRATLANTDGHHLAFAIEMWVTAWRMPKEPFCLLAKCFGEAIAAQSSVG
jgi:hypothetical protein